ncbi:MAG: acetyltransferase [Synergistes jonesii]|uniref:acetyltransferase n=1 Tax=Synergistes jonesii TaxID=2754 RepID=UPI002A75D5CA|nr:acetyltransferase [Synergistes jonesii]MDY2984830.1 acetyltransferase [Synergistes jonesii]
MKEDIAIYGAGGFARETLWLLESFLNEKYNVTAFVVDDGYYEAAPKELCGKPVYSEGFLLSSKSRLAVALAFGQPEGRKRTFNKLKNGNKNLFFPVLVHPTTILAPDVEIGEGTIIRGSGLLSVGVKVGRGVLINGSNNLGHDVIVEDFCSIMPRCTISGNVTIGECTSIGATSFIIEKKHIGRESIIAPGSIVLKSFPDKVTVMGNPAKVYLRHN